MVPQQFPGRALAVYKQAPQNGPYEGRPRRGWLQGTLRSLLFSEIMLAPLSPASASNRPHRMPEPAKDWANVASSVGNPRAHSTPACVCVCDASLPPSTALLCSRPPRHGLRPFLASRCLRRTQRQVYAETAALDLRPRTGEAIEELPDNTTVAPPRAGSSFPPPSPRTRTRVSRSTPQNRRPRRQR